MYYYFEYWLHQANIKYSYPEQILYPIIQFHYSATGESCMNFHHAYDDTICFGKSIPIPLPKRKTNTNRLVPSHHRRIRRENGGHLQRLARVPPSRPHTTDFNGYRYAIALGRSPSPRWTTMDGLSSWIHPDGRLATTPSSLLHTHTNV